MSKTNSRNPSELSMLELFRMEAEQQAGILTDALLSADDQGDFKERINTMMRAAHSLKGAARLVECDQVVRLAHGLEDNLVRVESGALKLDPTLVDLMLEGVDMIEEVALEIRDGKSLSESLSTQIENLLGTLQRFGSAHEPSQEEDTKTAELREWDRRRQDRRQEPRRGVESDVALVERTVRLSVEQFDELISLAGEAQSGARWLRPYTAALRRLKRQQWELVFDVEDLREQLRQIGLREDLLQRVNDIQQRLSQGRDFLQEKVSELEVFDVKLEALATRLHAEVMSSRMRPFRDGVRGLPRIVRAIARGVGKEVHLSLSGMDTLVDREILQLIEAPLSHLLNNAVDHGVETPEERVRIGKPREGNIELQAYQQRGLVVVRVTDDGRGIDRQRVTDKLVARKMIERAMAEAMTDRELFEFILLPGFSTRDEVSTLSGRGVGLDAVAEMLKEVGGSLEIASRPGAGSEFMLRFPVTRTIVHSLIVIIAGEPYAIPLNRVDRILKIARRDVEDNGAERFASVDGVQLLLVDAAKLLELDARPTFPVALSVLMVPTSERIVGLVVDKVINEKELIVRPMPESLGKVRDVSATATLDNDEPVFILDVDEMLQRARVTALQALGRIATASAAELHVSRKRILVVDDSITVRELERQMLTSDGFEVAVAVDGLAGWNALKNDVFDLVITDVDMPRLDGMQLVRMIRADETLQQLPVIMVSYIDREEDGQRALAAGATRFVAKSSFHDDTLRRQVRELIGEAVV